jgi:hypothetical protein
MIELLLTDLPDTIGFKVTGKLHDEDYKTFVPLLEEAISTAKGKVRLLAQFEDFHGWDWHAAWDDLVLGVKHYSDVERLALVGDRDWERLMAAFCKPFTQATVKYFEAFDIDAAWAWLREGTA